MNRVLPRWEIFEINTDSIKNYYIKWILAYHIFAFHFKNKQQSAQQANKMRAHYEDLMADSPLTVRVDLLDTLYIFEFA